MIHQILQNNFPKQIQVTKEFQEGDGLTPNENDDYMLIKKKFQFKLSDNNEILYSIDGRIIRMDCYGAQQIMTNLEQINHLHWKGNWDQNFKKIGKWTAQWKDDYEGVGGLYNENGNKEGIWKEMINNFWDQAKVYEIGDYVNGIRQGVWIYVFENKKIGGGVYKENGLKNGKWLELGEKFQRSSQIIYEGDYQNGKKCGAWNTMYRGKGNYEFTKIGGGYFNEGQKDGDWIELSDFFSILSQVIYEGKYQFGKKYGRWNTQQRFSEESKFQQIGGGNFNEHGMKQGNWVELCSQFQSYIQITYSGDYQNGLKIGKWATLFKEYSGDKFRVIGGGSYDLKGVKNGVWVELCDRFYRNYQLIFQGEYQNGLKSGMWTSQFRSRIDDEYEKIGGGLYDLHGWKEGIWVELDDYFSRNAQVISKGKYKNNKKYGQWSTKFEGETIGGGFYNIEGMKEGYWIDLSDRYSEYIIEQLLYHFYRYNSYIYQGEYKNGRRSSKWTIVYYNETRYDGDTFQFRTKIGGGQFDNNGLKTGKWEELISDYNLCKQVTFIGEYQKGIKKGIWNTMLKESSILKLIGFGLFDEIGMRNGKWIEIADEFRNANQLIQSGEYKNGQKNGEWVIMLAAGKEHKECEIKERIHFSIGTNY
ncbi:unnamed protein product [Paramecium octaurelia]|uniref:Uncharacterized protein n=1 Tax=Paramecium octaurelia TaxID=43137 RepID=A0A8S1WUU7_PAROT|nr:unnamed protein product [Paramecium octaurelia]